MSRSTLLVLTGLALAIGLNAANAAPKHDKHSNEGKHGGGEDVQVDLRGPTIDIGQVRITLGNNRELIGPAQALPPGIRKNLARGKPLPPGIAKRFDSRLQGQLPYYAGYEWQQVGTDVVLVAIATGIIYEVLQNVLD
ncbi:RcnB family protein [Pseudomonas sp. J452]|uniref:RcnB family protein n=1 Tax=Pseudomonas sp. J452 TaxID=2898441 RepID=UPI0021ADB904|nr:RcnB family protein [Pseudomonas sp. J452]UUY06734.1 RcnB family protein [Pseudomonas sp. J452]